MKSIELDVVATRGDEVESRHRVHAAVVGSDDLALAMDAAVRAARVVALADDPSADIEHLL